MVLAAVSLNEPIGGLADSKKLSRIARSRLLPLINTDSNRVIITAVSSADVDREGLSRAMQIGCESLFSSISKLGYDRIIVDGNINYLAEHPNTVAIIGADSTIQECMAASVVAKEYRDEYMMEVAKNYPRYGFETHVGYGTAKHVAAIKKWGLIDEHRRSFKPIKDHEYKNRSNS